tara:strand:+ start:1905 stop:2183 length:279 start_codon:yes stop_codon:yes gene_type:complete
MASLLPQIPIDTPLSVGQFVRVNFPNSTISKDGVVRRVIHPKKPSNPKDGNYEIIKIDNNHKNFWLANTERTVITTAKRAYIQDFASEAVAV